MKVWSAASGACIHELRSHGNQYQSCIFHPRYPKVLIVGGYQVNAGPYLTTFLHSTNANVLYKNNFTVIKGAPKTCVFLLTHILFPTPLVPEGRGCVLEGRWGMVWGKGEKELKRIF